MRWILLVTVDCASLFDREPGRIAIAGPFQTSRVIPLMLDVSQHHGLSATQLCVVTSLLPVLAGREVTLMFCAGCLFRLQRGESGVVTLIPAIRTILGVPPELRSGRVRGLRRSQLGMVA